MTTGFSPVRLCRGAFVAAFGGCLALSVDACVSDKYEGVSRRPGIVASDLSQLAGRAQVGDKPAQFELGSRYEEGRGVPADLKKAKNLYRQAAADTGGTLRVHSPASGKAKGWGVSIDSGPRQAGLSEAKARLSRLAAPAGTQAISDIAFGGDGPAPNSTRADSLAASRGALAGTSQDVLTESQDVPIRPPEEGRMLLQACRSRPELDSRAFAASDPFDYGYCQGYILSKLFRLSSEKLHEIEVKRKHAQGDIPPANSWIMLDILDVLRSPQFDAQGLDELKQNFKGPVTAEKVLDRAINDLLYAEPR